MLDRPNCCGPHNVQIQGKVIKEYELRLPNHSSTMQIAIITNTIWPIHSKCYAFLEYE